MPGISSLRLRHRRGINSLNYNVHVYINLKTRITLTNLDFSAFILTWKHVFCNYNTMTFEIDVNHMTRWIEVVSGED